MSEDTFSIKLGPPRSMDRRGSETKRTARSVSMTCPTTWAILLLPLEEDEAAQINQCKEHLLRLSKEHKLDIEECGHSGACEFAATFVSSLIEHTGWGENFVIQALHQFREKKRKTVH